MPADPQQLTRRESLNGRVSEALAEIRRMKKAAPHMFSEWLELRHAQDNLTKAKGRLALDRAAWNKLGKDPK